jgi:hypothetical protein
MEHWTVTIWPPVEQLRDRGLETLFVDDGTTIPSVTGKGDSPEAARRDARKRLAAWYEALELLEKAEREVAGGLSTPSGAHGRRPGSCGTSGISAASSSTGAAAGR